ncbi:putative P2Y purinoceptor 10 [Marmota flaviventris]|uniref:putative P2Y purinoceptor 10 n=1 Tax=Marmota flaviventris TaxID=93162 RepID=UPI000FFF68F5|nr:putative P2Y purinoceptor 10 [Marmota flaviventris]XP_027789806.1 putative P2Y purinoceptor 10 [Marmota flaviventris]
MGNNNTNSTRANCTDLQMPFQDSLYATTYILIFIPGLVANSAALWVLCRFISKKNKAIIFMINLSVADLAHVLSLPLRIYYYINHHWPFQRALCLLCFYLKYLNMYASIFFLTCISLQRCFFLLKPFRARNWKRRYDVGISAAIWVIVGTACLPLPILRSANLAKNTKFCFADLGLHNISMASSIGMVTAAELGGFVLPVIIITYCTWKTRKSLQEFQVPPQNTKERKKALRMVLMCAVVFIVCFTPYHLNFPFFMMVKQHVFSNCSFIKSTLCFHIISLCLANLNCCLDPVVYYFMTSEFRDQFSEHGVSVLQSCVRCKDNALEIRQREEDLQTISLECLDDSKTM